jgi:hypothetical protein
MRCPNAEMAAWRGHDHSRHWEFLWRNRKATHIETPPLTSRDYTKRRRDAGGRPVDFLLEELAALIVVAPA